MKTKHLFILTGRSGSGKSTAIAAFEDAGFYCVDNMPVVLLPQFVELPMPHHSEVAGFALVMDLREKGFLSQYPSVFKHLQQKGYTFEIIFMEANEKVLLQRYSQTRRQHPLSQGGSLLSGIRAENVLLKDLRQRADKIIDTSAYTVHELKSAVFSIVREHAEPAPIKINVLSFGFKHGIPLHADLLVDVRFLPNPYFVKELKALNGEDPAVETFVAEKAATRHFLEKYTDLLDYLIPLYEKEGKAYLTIGIGCTGGRHRSVVIAKAVFSHISTPGRDVTLTHRDIDVED